jgi:DNA-binding NtrC family response regulator
MSEKQPLVCVIDDDVSARESIDALLREEGYDVQAFASAEAYLARTLEPPPGCLVLDVSMPGLSGLALQERLRGTSDLVPIVFVSGQSDVPMSVRALKLGASDFLTKPFDPDRLLEAIRATLAERRPAAPAESSAGIVGRSAALLAVMSQVQTVATTDSTVLVYGETGTGKELIARAIHEASGRRDGPFVKLNCSAIPSGLLESELLGHERGAFTGAVAQRIGRFELAHGGTLFLDEIGEIATELQPKLLRLLQEREFERVGGTRTVRADVRLIAATNRDLSEMVKARTFREDLFYRLNVFPITLPSLRERRQDIPELAHHFVAQLAPRLRRPPCTIALDALQRLQAYDWPGNIRELQNVVERALILSHGPTLYIPPFETKAAVTAPSAPELADDLASVNRAHILGVLEATGWVVAGPNGAAARLGVKRSTLVYRMKKLGIHAKRSSALEP